MENEEEEILTLTKQFYTISEVAKIVNVNVSKIRYWENNFEILKPHRNKKGNRLFTPDDVRNTIMINKMLTDQKLTIKGAKKKLKENYHDTVNNLEVIRRLEDMKNLLLEISKHL